MVHHASKTASYGFSIENPEQQVGKDVVFPSGLSTVLVNQYNAGSSGVGGTLRFEMQKELRRLADAGQVRAFIAANYPPEMRVPNPETGLNGGMGMTDELNLGHYLPRLIAINIDGDPTFHVLR